MRRASTKVCRAASICGHSARHPLCRCIVQWASATVSGWSGAPCCHPVSHLPASACLASAARIRSRRRSAWTRSTIACTDVSSSGSAFRSQLNLTTHPCRRPPMSSVAHHPAECCHPVRTARSAANAHRAGGAPHTPKGGRIRPSRQYRTAAPLTESVLNCAAFRGRDEFGGSHSIRRGGLIDQSQNMNARICWRYVISARCRA